MFKSNNNLSVVKLKNKIFKSACIGIFLFLSSVAGAGISHYLSTFPEYDTLSKEILSLSLIDFFIGIGVLFAFRNYILMYKKMNEQNDL